MTAGCVAAAGGWLRQGVTAWVLLLSALIGGVLGGGGAVLAMPILLYVADLPSRVIARA